MVSTHISTSMNVHVHACAHTSMCYILAISSSISQRAAAQVIADIARVHQTGPSIFTQRSFTIFYNFVTDVLGTIISKPIMGTAVCVQQREGRRGEREREREKKEKE